MSPPDLPKLAQKALAADAEPGGRDAKATISEVWRWLDCATGCLGNEGLAWIGSAEKN
jgi:hypothetical protein